MCGLIHVKRTSGTPAFKAVLKRYHKQKARGSEGFGFVELLDGHVIGVQRAEDEKDIIKLLEKSIADEIIFHHRTPTSTPNLVEATHPIIVKNKSLKYNWYIIHNGIIYNDSELKKEHETDGFKYTTLIKKQFVTVKNTYTSEMFNDSESLAIDFAKSIENNTLMKSRGSIALIALCVEKKTKKALKLYFARNTQNPLCLEIQGKKDTRDFMAISSESGKDLKENTLFTYDYQRDDITEEFKTIGTTISYGNYSDYDDDGYYGGRGGWGHIGYLPPARNEVPDFGHYDEDKMCWVAPQEKFDTDGFPLDAINDALEPFQYDEAIDELKADLKDARIAEDYDLIIELEAEIEEMQTRYATLLAEAKKKYDKRVEQNTKNALHQNHLGFSAVPSAKAVSTVSP